MQINTINDFVREVLKLHPSRSSSSCVLLPRVILHRLTNDMIEQHTRMKNRIESSPDRPESPFSTSKNISPSKYSSISLLDVESPLLVSDSGSSKGNKDDDDLSVSSSSSDLPDLKDPSWIVTNVDEDNHFKTKETKKMDGNLMKKARQTFQTKASRYKSSQDYIKSSKSSPVKESRSGTSESVNDNANSAYGSEGESAYTQETGVKDNDRRFDKSVDEIKLSDKMRKAIERCVVQKENSIDLPKTTEVVTIDENSLLFENEDSNSSNCTVLFDENDVGESFLIKSIQTLGPEDIDMLNNSSSSEAEVIKAFKETAANNKRKTSPAENEDHIYSKKKQKQYDPEILVKESPSKKIPMVVIPFSCKNSSQNPVPLTRSASPLLATPMPAPSIASVPTQTERQSNINDTQVSNTINQNSSDESLTAGDKLDSANIDCNSSVDVTETTLTSTCTRSEKIQNNSSDNGSDPPAVSEFSFIKLQELTLERIKYEEEIQKLEEEYMKKLEPLKKELKRVDDEVKELMILKRKGEAKKKLNNTESLQKKNPSPVPEVEEPAVTPAPKPPYKETPTTVNHMTASQNEGSNIPGVEKTLINVIPAASIKNFGGNSIQTIKVKAKKIFPVDNQSSPKVNLINQNQHTRMPLQVTQNSPAVSSPSTLTPQYLPLDELQPPPANVTVRSAQHHPPLAANRQLIPVAVTSVTSPRVYPPAAAKYSSLNKQATPNVTFRTMQEPNTATLPQSSNNVARVLPTAIQSHQNPNPHQVISPSRSVHQNNPVISDNQQSQAVPVRIQMQQDGQQLIRIVTNQQQQQQQQYQQQQLPTLYIPYGNTSLLQQSNISQPPVQQQYALMQGQQQHSQQTPNAVQGHVIGGGSYPSAVGSTNDCSNSPQVNIADQRPPIPSSFLVNVPTQNTDNNNTSNQKQTFRQVYLRSNSSQITKPVHPVPGSNVIAGSVHPFIPSSTATVNSIGNSNIVTPQEKNRNVNKSLATTTTLSEPSSSTKDKNRGSVTFSHEVDNQPVCVKCGSEGIFTCCNDVVYCSTTCQGNDWETHQIICTNSSSVDS